MPTVTHRAWFTKSVSFRSSGKRCGNPPSVGLSGCEFPVPTWVCSLGRFEASAMTQNDLNLMLMRDRFNCRTSEMFYMNYADNMCQRMLLLFLLTELFVSLGSRQQRISTVLWPLGEAAMATKFSGMPAFLTDKNNPAGYCVQGAIEFGMDSRRLIQRCTKPDAKEFLPQKEWMPCCVQ